MFTRERSISASSQPCERVAARGVLALVGGMVFLLGSCTDVAPARPSTQPLIYGKDSRRDPHAFADQAWASRALEFSGALVRTQDLDLSDPNAIRFVDQETLGETFSLCPEVPFREQTHGAFCSGTLIGPDILLTAGHCLDIPCSELQVVFDYAARADGKLLPITSDEVFGCEEVLVREWDDRTPAGPDFAVLRLSRAANGRTPAEVDFDTTFVEADTAVEVAGFPLGLPLKLADGASVRNTPEGADYFLTNLDAFQGNSGSAVFHSDTKKVIGIVVRGPTGKFFRDEERGCDVDLVCDDDKTCPGSDSFYARRAMQALCATNPQPGLCACGNGSCAADESPATCPEDCGSSCGDSVCNGPESATTCPVDCGSCGNGICDEEPSSCCSDCGCGGDSCAAATPVEPVSQSIFGETATASNQFTSSCTSARGSDRVYQFTLTEETEFDAIATGRDTILSLRTDCGDVTSEVACNDDDFNTPFGFAGHLRETLDAGSYHLIVDGFPNQDGAYTLELLFNAPDGMCESARSIDAMDGYVIKNDAATQNAHHGFCGGSRGNEHVYSFEMAEAGPFVASTAGHDSVLYLRSECDPYRRAIACNDDAPQGKDGSSRIAVRELRVGKYFLYVDSYEVSSPYELTVNFCQDGDCCPSDPAKTIAGSCGCGVAEDDSDGDGRPDCVDECPSDPNKVTPSLCGCGMPDVDSDGDAVPDCLDQCPTDPNKLTPGPCGCGVPDTDSDSDGTLDCDDMCPNDADKTEPGQCGCRFAEVDNDNDGVSDCVDACANDPNKTMPGSCGCGTPDTDADGDGTPACQDACDNDSLKTEPGACGCGVLDRDRDADGTVDCLDACPLDPLKLAAGVCGCGVPEGTCGTDSTTGGSCSASRDEHDLESTLPFFALLSLLGIRARRRRKRWLGNMPRR